MCVWFCSWAGGRGVYPSMHCRWYLSMPCSRSPGDAIPACIAGGIPACLTAGLQGGLLLGDLLGGGCLVEDKPPGRLLLRAVLSYWNAFLFYLSFSMITSKSTCTRLISLLIIWTYFLRIFSTAVAQLLLVIMSPKKCECNDMKTRKVKSS